MSSETMTVEQLAKRLGMGHNRVSAGIDAGQIPGQRIGRQFYIRTSWVEEYERTGRVYTATNTPPPKHPYIKRVA